MKSVWPRMVCFLLLTMLIPAATAWAQGFPFPGKSTKQVEADPKRSYDVTEQCGPWMIMACSFSDEDADQQAHNLVLDLRANYGLEAFVWKQDFRGQETLTGRGVDKYGRPKKMQYQNPDCVLPEVAVLVGNYSSVDDSRAKKVLDELRSLIPKSLGGEGSDQSDAVTGFMADMRRLQKSFVSPSERLQQNRGPMCKAFLSPNPLLPKEFFRTEGLPDYIIEANSHLQYSLLKCPGKYTLKVGTFVGMNCIENSQRHSEIRQDKKDSVNHLENAEKQASELCAALRKLNYKAYEFHDVGSSIVTVGSFDRIGTPDENGVIELEQGIVELMEQFRGRPADQQLPNLPQGSYVSRTVSGSEQGKALSLDVQPQLVEVPGKSALARTPGSVIRK